MSPLEVGPIYAPGAGPPHPAVRRRKAPPARRVPPPPAPPTPLQQPAAPPQPAPAVAQAPPAPQVLYEEQAVPAPVSTARAHRRFDWVLGVILGIVLGLAVAAGFVFIGSEDTVDAPRIHGVDAGTSGEDAAPGGGQAEPERLPAE